MTDTLLEQLVAVAVNAQRNAAIVVRQQSQGLEASFRAARRSLDASERQMESQADQQHAAQRADSDERQRRRIRLVEAAQHVADEAHELLRVAAIDYVAAPGVPADGMAAAFADAHEAQANLHAGLLALADELVVNGDLVRATALFVSFMGSAKDSITVDVASFFRRLASAINEAEFDKGRDQAVLGLVGGVAGVFRYAIEPVEAACGWSLARDHVRAARLKVSSGDLVGSIQVLLASRPPRRNESESFEWDEHVRSLNSQYVQLVPEQDAHTAERIQKLILASPDDLQLPFRGLLAMLHSKLERASEEASLLPLRNALSTAQSALLEGKFMGAIARLIPHLSPASAATTAMYREFVSEFSLQLEVQGCQTSVLRSVSDALSKARMHRHFCGPLQQAIALRLMNVELENGNELAAARYLVEAHDATESLPAGVDGWAREDARFCPWHYGHPGLLDVLDARQGTVIGALWLQCPTSPVVAVLTSRELSFWKMFPVPSELCSRKSEELHSDLYQLDEGSQLTVRFRIGSYTWEYYTLDPDSFSVNTRTVDGREEAARAAPKRARVSVPTDKIAHQSTRSRDGNLIMTTDPHERLRVVSQVTGWTSELPCPRDPFRYFWCMNDRFVFVIGRDSVIRLYGDLQEYEKLR